MAGDRTGSGAGPAAAIRAAPARAGRASMPGGADGSGDGTATGEPRSAEGNASPAGPVDPHRVSAQPTRDGP